MKHYQNYIFDLYGTLVDIWTDENDPLLWQRMSELYSCCGADYSPDALKVTYHRMAVEEQEKLGALTGVQYPEIKLENVFLRLLKEAPVKHRTQLSLRGKKEQELWLAMIANTFRCLSTRRFRMYPRVKDAPDRHPRAGALDLSAVKRPALLYDAGAGASWPGRFL